MPFASVHSGLHTAKHSYSSNIINLCPVSGGIQTESCKPAYYTASY